jgi:ribonuclease P protein component
MVGHSDQGFRFGTLDRLHRPAEFAAVMASRSRASGGCFELRFRRRPAADAGGGSMQARLGLIIPKRLAKQAVLRNLLKRVAREAFRQAKPDLPPADMVLRLARPALAKGRSVDADLRREWRKTVADLLAGVSR